MPKNLINKVIVQEYLTGKYSQAEIAKHCNLTRQRISQIIKRYVPTLKKRGKN